MRGLDEHLSIGERVAWYRRRRGLSQEVLAGLVGRTADWLGKIENGRAPLDRLSVLGELARVLDVNINDLIGGPQLVDWNTDARQRTVPALRKAVLSYTSVTPTLGQPPQPPVDVTLLRREVAALWDAYQASRFGYVIHRVPSVLSDAHAAAQQLGNGENRRAAAQLALAYQVTAGTLTKVGELDLAWICSDRGLAAAERSGDDIVRGSLMRSVAHSLLANGQYEDALAVVGRAADRLGPSLATATPAYLSVFGSLYLVGAMAAARSNDPTTARAFLSEADKVAQRLGPDANYLWTAFGPTNVAVHKVSVAAELGDVQIAAELGPRIDTSSLPVERRVRHALEVARAHSALNRPDESLGIVLAAEADAPEQVRYHFISRELVLGWVRNSRARPRLELRQLAERLHVA